MSEQNVAFTITARFRRVCVRRHVDARWARCGRRVGAVLTAEGVLGHVAADSQDGADAGQDDGVGHQNQRASPPRQ